MSFALPHTHRKNPTKMFLFFFTSLEVVHTIYKNEGLVKQKSTQMRDSSLKHKKCKTIGGLSFAREHGFTAGGNGVCLANVFLL
jgi:hypothetical protein